MGEDKGRESVLSIGALFGVKPMKGFTRLVVGLAVLGMCCLPVLAGEEAAEIKGTAAKLFVKTEGDAAAAAVAPSAYDANATEFDLMVRELKLTAEQQAKVGEKFQAMEKALADWDKENLARFEKIEEAIENARKAGNSDEVQRLFQQKTDLKDERAKLAEKFMREILALLTPEQQLEWEGFKLYQQMVARYKALKLTDDQLVKLRELCRQSAKEETATRDKDGNVATVRAKLIKDIREQVLTQEQRDKLDGKHPSGASGTVTPPPPPPPPKNPSKTDNPKNPKNPPKNPKPPKPPKGTVKTLP